MNRCIGSLVVFTVLVTILSIGCGGAVKVDDPLVNRSPTCGTMALLNLIQLSAQKCTLEEVQAALPGQDARGHSLEELREGAKRFRLTVDGIQLLKEAQFDRPLIAFVEQQGHGHFVAIRPAGHTGRKVQILDGLADPRVVDLHDLIREPGWTGLALISRQPRWMVQFSLILSWSAILVGSVGIAAIVARKRLKRVRI
jgi:ABC-type bacteriocin/lantibiotic exporter with double-glycine peptidase domain